MRYRLLTTIVMMIAGHTVLMFSAAAHHSFSATFDGETVVEVTGQVTRVKWSNPHVRFELRGIDEQGNATTYEIESHSLSLMRRMQIPAEAFQPGEIVTVAGNPALRDPHQVFARTALMSDGRELVMDPWTPPRWGENAGTKEGIQGEVIEDSDSRARMFRVWSTALDDMAVFPFPETLNPTLVHRYPLTASARAALDAFNPITDTPTLNCAPKGMPAIMEQPYPMEFIDDGTTIRLRIEEYDHVRQIYMDESNAQANVPSLLGYSRGSWDDGVLVVQTTNANYGHFNTIGVPLTTDAEILERFMLSEDGLQLDYQLSVTDPAVFTERVELSKYWIALDDVEIRPYVCTSE